MRIDFGWSRVPDATIFARMTHQSRQQDTLLMATWKFTV